MGKAKVWKEEVWWAERWHLDSCWEWQGYRAGPLPRYREVSASHCRPTSLCRPSLSLFRFAFVPASVASFLPPLSLHCVENASNTQHGFSSEELIRPIVYSARLKILTLALLDYRPV